MRENVLHRISFLLFVYKKVHTRCIEDVFIVLSFNAFFCVGAVVAVLQFSFRARMYTKLVNPVFL